MSSILTSTGIYFDFINPEFARFDIGEIAHALSHICRFTGHCREFYSVAQHSVLVSQVHPTLEALMHDASEAYLGDVSSPLKALLPCYREIEHRVERAIFRHFRLCHGMDAVRVEYADRVLLATERRDLLPYTPEEWPSLNCVEPMSQTIQPLPPKEACSLFLARFDELTQAAKPWPHLTAS